MTISMNADTANRLNGGMQTGNAIELPYFTPKFFVVNGDPRMKAVGGAHFFGGFAVTVEDWQKACEEWGVAPCDTPGFVQSEMDTQDGKTLDVFMGRSLIVAPIANRVTWANPDGQRFSEYAPGTRQHAQVICELAKKSEDGAFETFGPILITAKGYQAKYVLDSFAAWDRATKSIRGKIAPGVPAWCFYLSVGTFGKERKQVMVGKGAQSPITPITAFVPKEITAELMERLFVGQDSAEVMLTYLEGADEWLHAYDQKNPMLAAGVQLGGQASVADDFGLDPLGPNGEEIPF
jgi:hypothetical protein